MNQQQKGVRRLCAPSEVPLTCSWGLAFDLSPVALCARCSKINEMFSGLNPAHRDSLSGFELGPRQHKEMELSGV
ncbi:hypothetical protein MDA_GLEAN10025034 [Myotis davidii]|uniref:Uncharacterized protein n=1 Tax=Myotis davidii TaxID=225400 RepID=L5M848_MYODS|nr:hypothetical protein MDA_GLEAN10025034 [Myotis davidii]